MSNFEKSFQQFYDEHERNYQSGKNALDVFNYTKEIEDVKTRRLEQLESNEKAKTTVADFAKKVAMRAAAVIAIAGVVVASGHPTKEIMDTDQARYVREFQVESVTVHGGPNLRSNPSVANGETNNVLIDLGDEEQIINSSYQGVAYYYDSGSDANGAWIGFPAAEFADALQGEAFINSRTADKIKDHEDETDDTVWINKKYVNYEKVEEP